MKLIARILGYKTKYRIQTVKVGVRERYQIQKSTFGFIWSTVINPLIVSPQTPYEFKIKNQAEKALVELQKK